jgi:hypothetical protein
MTWRLIACLCLVSSCNPVAPTPQISTTAEACADGRVAVDFLCDPCYRPFLDPSHPLHHVIVVTDETRRCALEEGSE